MWKPCWCWILLRRVHWVPSCVAYLGPIAFKMHSNQSYCTMQLPAASREPHLHNNTQPVCLVAICREKSRLWPDWVSTSLLWTLYSETCWWDGNSLGRLVYYLSDEIKNSELGFFAKSVHSQVAALWTLWQGKNRTKMASFSKERIVSMSSFIVSPIPCPTFPAALPTESCSEFFSHSFLPSYWSLAKKYRFLFKCLVFIWTCCVNVTTIDLYNNESLITIDPCNNESLKTKTNMAVCQPGFACCLFCYMMAFRVWLVDTVTYLYYTFSSSSILLRFTSTITNMHRNST